MKIHNIRVGLATNSSSTHSVVLFKEPQRNDYSPFEFGWDDFTVADDAGKRTYLAVCIAHQLYKHLGEKAANFFATQLCGISPDIFDDGGWSSPYIDHQSVLQLPTPQGKLGVNLPFAQAFLSWLLNPNVAILGGNDNSDEAHPLLSSGTLPEFIVWLERDAPFWARHDKEYGFWTLFRPDTGAKLRIVLDDKPMPTHASSPELVDLKITNYCGRGCSFCYQNSSRQGKHANHEDVYSVLWNLSELGTLEVALGGGEPTEHPEFGSIVNRCRYYNMAANFTTGDVWWLKDKKNVDLLASGYGACAVSVHSLNEWHYALTSILWSRLPARKVGIQVIPALWEQSELETLLKDANDFKVRVTLLGYKACGRGVKDADAYLEKEKSCYVLVFRALQKMNWLIGIDTALAARWDEQLQRDGISDLSYTTKEGAFSCYIDGVCKEFGPSSYGEQMQPFGNLENELPQAMISEWGNTGN